MNEPERHYDREAEIAQEMWAIENEESAEKTIIGDDEFSHRAWLAAENAELHEKKQDIEATVTISGEFAGLKS